MNPLNLLGVRAKWLGTGIAIGLLAYPLVKKGIAKLQPKIDELTDLATAQAEGLLEKGSDLMAKARESVRKEEQAGAPAPAAAPSRAPKAPRQPSLDA